jgi:ABC-type transport system involved in multi-copper enzyme maturation permease subunit
MTWLIARRAALEALQDRLSLLVGLFFAFVVPLGLLGLVARVTAGSGQPGSALGPILASYLWVVGVLPAFSAVGIAAGQFAGEKERGLLTPLLASPASNLAIFAGKVLGAIIPPLLYAAVAEVVYLVGVAALFGPAALGLLPPAASVATVLLVPVVTCFAAVVASLISSRVRTFNAAQQLGGLVLMPVWGAVVGLAGRMQDWGPLALVGVIGSLLLLDVVLTLLAAATWRREEVLAQR